MKILVTKCVCDVCKKEINPNEPRYMIGFGVGNWNDDTLDSSFEENAKDVCGSCYKTILALVNDGDTQKSEPEVEQPKKRTRGGYDKDQIVNLWKKGYTRTEIVKKTGLTKGRVDYAIHQAIEDGEVQNKKLAALTKKNLEPGFKTVVDESGLVLSIEKG